MKPLFAINSNEGKHCGRIAHLSAFSLVEVTLSLGIFAFAILGIVGVIPAGLQASRVATSQVAESNILMQIHSELSRLPFSERENYAAQTFYCDYDGRRLDREAGSIFTATLQILPPHYPDSEKLSDIRRRIERVVVTIRKSGENVSQAHRSSFTVVNSGH